MNTEGYFDYAAATPVDQRVAEVMRPFSAERFGNPSSPHEHGRAMRAVLEDARASIARQLGARKTEIIFTASSTEAAMIAIKGVARAFPGSRAATSVIEHLSVLVALEAGFGKAKVRAIGVGTSGLVDARELAEAVDDATTLVCLHYANNEIGTLQPIIKMATELARIRRERQERGVSLPIYLYCDAAQAGLLTLQISRLGVDMLSMGGSKLYGPAGSGFLYIRTGTKLKAPMVGGGQEGGLRGGTENVGAAVGLAAALELVQKDRALESKRLERLRDQLWQRVTNRIPGVSLNGSQQHRLPNNLNICVEGCGGEDLVAYLDAAGFAVGTGSACAAAHQSPSHVLLALGRSLGEAQSSLRLTLGRFTTAAEVARFVPVLESAVEKIRSNMAKPEHRVQ